MKCQTLHIVKITPRVIVSVLGILFAAEGNMAWADSTTAPNVSGSTSGFIKSLPSGVVAQAAKSAEPAWAKNLDKSIKKVPPIVYMQAQQSMNSVQEFIFPGEDPCRIAVDAKGDVWVTDFVENGFVYEFKSSGMPIARYPVGPWPHGITIDPQGRIWITNDTKNGTLTEMNPDGSIAGRYDVGPYPYGVAVIDNYVYVTNHQRNGAITLLKFHGREPVVSILQHEDNPGDITVTTGNFGFNDNTDIIGVVLSGNKVDILVPPQGRLYSKVSKSTIGKRYITDITSDISGNLLVSQAYSTVRLLISASNQLFDGSEFKLGSVRGKNGISVKAVALGHTYGDIYVLGYGRDDVYRFQGVYYEGAPSHASTSGGTGLGGLFGQ
ncbi:hypothetical protein [Acidithiobacillus sulfuriphilus]|uniref:Uncharacterized protein n=1 Tax=Acidithiobacillus sulfuriphilus TaxID=1867749 RepID=A0ACD5HM83_9PROT|nr:hypothetical protein [Acidithiobacillus sulfuriphilus]